MASRFGARPDMKVLIETKCRDVLKSLLLRDENRLCADCCSKGPRWASWNLGIFLCIRCAGLHRKMGVHISKVKSVDLDTWTPDQVSCMEQMGNLRGRECYEMKLDVAFSRPQTDSSLEFFIREKYEGLRYAKDGFQLPRAADRIEWFEDLLAGKAGNKKKSANLSEPFIPALAKPPGFSAPAIKPPASAMNSTVKADLLGLDIETPPAPPVASAPKEDLATLLGGDDLVSVPPANPMSNDSILALFGGAGSNSNWANFPN